MDDWSIVIAGSSLAVASGGVGIAIWSLVRAGRANKFAKDAVEEARAANEFAAVANDLSRESNGIAVGAKDLAEEANTFSRRAEALETERHDVAWEGRWEGPGRWVYTNVGDDEAVKVRASLTVDREKAEARVERVPAGSQVVLELPRAREALAKEEREVRDLRARVRQGDPRVYSGVGTQLELRSAELSLRMHAFEERVVWVSPLGKPHIHAPKTYNGSLEDD